MVAPVWDTNPLILHERYDVFSKVKCITASATESQDRQDDNSHILRNDPEHSLDNFLTW